jgi:hypothetical protein
MPLESTDRTLVRDLAQRVLERAHDPLNAERRAAWLDVHSGVPRRPMILAEWGGVRDPRPPFAPALVCTDPLARGLEAGLRQQLWVFEELRDDHVIEPFFNVNWAVSTSGYGAEKTSHEVNDGGILNARSWEAPITDIARDFQLLKPRAFSVNREGTRAYQEQVAAVLGDILPVRCRGGFWWTLGMTNPAIDLIGLEPLMLFMYDDPAGLHRLMRFLCDDHLAFARWLQTEGLLSLNHENDYIGSGSMGYTRDLPSPAWRPGGPAALCDQWVLLESQETVGVSPTQFAEFIFPYQHEIAREFGLVYYGCCEPVHTRWEVVRRLPNLRAVSVAPLCSQEIMAEAMGRDYVFSRKPNPTLISTTRFDEAAIRADLRLTLDLTARHGCPTEIIMKDVHTLHNEPGRLARWVQLAREEAARD